MCAVMAPFLFQVNKFPHLFSTEVCTYYFTNTKAYTMKRNFPLAILRVTITEKMPEIHTEKGLNFQKK